MKGKLDYQEKIHQLALSLIRGIGEKVFKDILQRFHTAVNFFNSPPRLQYKVTGVSKEISNQIQQRSTLNKAKEIYEQHRAAGVRLISWAEDEYPHRLKDLYDCPMFLYCKGNLRPNVSKVISIVGSREATSYGKAIVQELVSGLASYNATIISGLAYGIDIQAHRAALKEGIPTIAVVATGLNITYPPEHHEEVEAMQALGGIISEYPLNTDPQSHYFPARNRIVAGMSDATIVIEAGKISGAIITADLANNYNRDVLAVPGNLNKKYSEGCNHLIKTHRANLLTSIEDIAFLLNWEENFQNNSKNVHPKRVQLSSEEEAVFQALKELEKTNPNGASLKELCIKMKQNQEDIRAILLHL